MHKHSKIYWRTTIYFLAIVTVYGVGMILLVYGPGRSFIEYQATERVIYEIASDGEKNQLNVWNEKLQLKRGAANDVVIASARQEKTRYLENKLKQIGLSQVIDQVISRFLIIFAICMIGVVLVLGLLLRLILSPLEMLIEGASRVAAGDLNFNFKATIQSKDELGNLAAVLHDLTTNFNELMNLLQNTVRMGQKNLAELRANPAQSEKNLNEMDGLIQSMKDLIEFFGRK